MGRVVEGTIEAESERLVVAQLRERGYLTTRLREHIVAPSFGDQMRALTSVPRQEFVVFTRQLATMVGAGLPLVSALDVTGRQAENRRLRDVLEKLRGGIEAGGSLSGEMAKHPAVFSHLYVNTVRAGEVSGALDRVLNFLADYLEREFDLIQRIKTTATYPAIVMAATILVGFLAVFVVLPNIAVLFKGLQVTLPWPTVVLIIASGVVRRYWYILVGSPLGMVIVFVVLSRTRWGRVVVDTLLLRIPVLGRIILKLALARFARMFAMIARSGVPLVEGMEVISHSLGNAVVGAAVEAASRDIREGQAIAAALGESPIFPPMISRMAAVGEQTGALDDVMDKVADFYDREVDNTVRRFASIIEPVMIIGVGGAVGFVAVAMLLPLWRLIGAIR